jgi:hypothetical protein
VKHHPEEIHWGAIGSVSEQPGVYAWYYNPRFATFDRKALEEALETDPQPSTVEAFIERHLFRYFKESPYEATIRGQLKATYVGELAETRLMSPDLARRLAEDAARRAVLWDALELMAPLFAAPLYIGMARNLRTRLRQHKSLIEGGLEKLHVSPQGNERITRDAGFATEVLRRRIPTERLSVFILTLPREAKETAADVENLLNRINYPVLGRN